MARNQKELQTGQPRGSFKRGDAHPTAAGLVYGRWNSLGEVWVTADAIEKHRASKAAYYIDNSNKIKARAKAWAAANPGRVKALSASWAKANPDKAKANHAAWVERNPEKLKAYNRGRYMAESDKVKARSIAWRKANPAKTKATSAAYAKANPDKCNERLARYKAMKLNQTPAMTMDETQTLGGFYAYAARLNAIFGKAAFHVDHTVPLSKGGLHHPSNLQVTPAKFNVTKGAHNNDRWEAPYQND